MGFTVVGANHFLASGHPAEDSTGPAPLGLLESTDGGDRWTARSLSGRADFHALRVAGGRTYGYDSGTGLMASTDRVTWENRSTLSLADFAVDPADPERLVATTAQGLVRSTNGGRSFGQPRGPVLLLVSWVGGTLVGVTPEGRVQVSYDDGAAWELRGSVQGAPEALLAAGRDEIYLASAGEGAGVPRRRPHICFPVHRLNIAGDAGSTHDQAAPAVGDLPALAVEPTPARHEAAGPGGIVKIGRTVRGDQVRLLYPAGLHFDGDDDGDHSAEGEPGGGHQCRAGLHPDQAGEDRVAHHAEHALGDQVGGLGGVDPNPPRLAHRLLTGDR